MRSIVCSMLVAAVLIAVRPAWAQVAPVLEITSVSPYGSNPGWLYGRVVGQNPSSYNVAALVFLSGLGFYSKPYCNATTVPVMSSDGSFSVLLTTGGIDPYATLVALLVVPASATVPCYLGEPGVPASLEALAVAEKLVPRPNPAQREIQFAGETWVVKSAPAPVGPGPNYFSDSAENVWVDSSGRLHLRVTNRGGQWYCAEIYSKRVIDFGDYLIQVDTPPSLDKNVVFGAFSWADAERNSREVDMLEIGRFGNGGDPNNAQNVVQPYTTAGNQMRFALPNTAPSVHTMSWRPDRLSFRSFDSLGTTLHSWDYAGQPLAADSPRLNFRLNLWLFAPPSDGNEAEVVISGFSFSPVAQVFVPISPCRVVDTRNASGTFGGPTIAAGNWRDFPLPTGSCGIPSGAQAYSLNITAVPHGQLGYLTVWPAGSDRPVVSTLNSDGRVKAVGSIVRAGPSGAVSIFVTDPADVIIDVNGYFLRTPAPTGLSFYTVPPCRLIDTRTAASGGPAKARQVRTIPVLSAGCTIPASAAAYSLNVTAVPHAPLGFLTVWPSGQSMPLVSTLNSSTGTIVANAAIAKAGNGGAVDVFPTDDTDLIIDINGYFAPAGSLGALSFYALTPCRVVDTRGPSGPLGGPALGGGQDRVFSIGAAVCGLPSTTLAYSLNATVVPQGLLGYLALWPGDSPRPLVSTLNAYDGTITSNGAIVPTRGTVGAFATYQTELILDVSGYFAP